MKILLVFFVFVLFVALAGAQDGGFSETEGRYSSKNSSDVQNIQSKEKDISTDEETKSPKAKSEPLIVNPPRPLRRAGTKKETHIAKTDKGNSKRTGKSNSKSRKAAKNKKKKSKKSKSTKAKLNEQWAVVQTDGAAAYKVPNFDSIVVNYYPAGKKIRISQKIFEGIGGFGAFYRINLPGDAYAFIADVDVAPELTSNNKSHVGQSQEKNPAFRSPAEEAPQQLPIFFTRYLGASFGFANFSEKFSGKVLNSSEWMVGFRSSGPGSLVEGLPLDASLLFHSGAPTYYTDGMTNTSASGFFVIGEVYLPIPLMATDAFLISTGLGMMATYTRFSVQIKETLFDSQEVRAGVAGQLGLTTRIGRFALRLDARYFYEKEAYTGYFATLMSRY